MKKAIVIGGSRGIGKAIAEALKTIPCTVIATSRKELNTADLASVKRFAKLHKTTDILVLNTGGPPQKDFFAIGENEWKRYHNQLFLGFCVLLQNIQVNKSGYIFVITSHIIKEPSIPALVLSAAYRTAFTAVFKVLSRHYAKHNISCINIAPGPIKTDRLLELVANLEEYAKTLPFHRVGNPEEIGNFIKSIVEYNIHYLHGTTVTFDGGLSQYVF